MAILKLFLELKKGLKKILDILRATSGVKVMDNPAKLEYPTPLENANDTEDVLLEGSDANLAMKAG